MRLSAIVACTSDGTIGAGGKLPWRLGTDLKRFRYLTSYSAVIMGRLTYESLVGPLRDRQNIVVSRTLVPESSPRSLVVRSPEAALDEARRFGGQEAFVIGGASIYEALLPRCEILHLTLVDGPGGGDAKFPLGEVDFVRWRLLEAARQEAGERDERGSWYLRFERGSWADS